MNKEDHISNHLLYVFSKLTDDESLSKSLSNNFAKLLINKIFYGYNKKNYPIINLYMKTDDKQVIKIAETEFTSFCQHHLLPFHGHINISYIPNQHIISFGSIIRLIRFLSYKPQTQESLCSELTNELKKSLRTEDVKVHIKATHLCSIASEIEYRHNIIETELRQGVFVK